MQTKDASPYAGIKGESVVAPVVIFGFNRPEHIEACFASLRHNPEASSASAYVFLDGPRNDADAPLVAEVRRIARRATFFRTTCIVERDKNWGLSQNVIDGVTQVVARHGSVIVVEDDLVVSPAFLSYMNAALARYREAPAVFSVSGYNFPPRIMKIPPDYRYDAFFVMRHMCWGWGTWKDRWDRADWKIPDYNATSSDSSWRRSFLQGGVDLPGMLDEQMRGRLNSWAVRWTYAHFANHSVCLVPVRPFVNNLGVDGTGTHMAASPRYFHPRLNCSERFNFPPNVYVDPVIARAFMSTGRRSFPIRALLKLLRVVGMQALTRRHRPKPVVEIGAGSCMEV
jgi:Glycosyl transferase family 2